LVHTITTKPVLYGSIAARLADTPSLVAAIAGLGPLFTSKGPKFAILRTVATIIYRLALNHPNAIAIFQNKSDRQTILSATGIDPAKTILIRGSGVDLSKYAYTDEPTGMPVVLMASRLVRNKGPELFVDAARLIRSNGIAASFWLAGDPDPESHGTISQEILNKWRQEGIVSVLGHRSDIVGLLAKCSIFVLPSTYGEGLPKVLVEAAACGRPVITTDHPGCRDAIIPGKTGLLIRPNAEALASAIETLLSNPQNRQAMGRAGRRLAVEEYDIRNVVDTHLRTYDALTRAAATRPATVSS
jgi:glycosyltransferase involved in cell wall biosynthesis